MPPKAPIDDPGRAVRRCDAARILKKELVLDPISHRRTEVLPGTPSIVKGLGVTDSHTCDRLDPLHVCWRGRDSPGSVASRPSVTTSVCLALAEARAITTPNRSDPGHHVKNGPHHHDPTRIPPMLGSTLEPPPTTECQCTAE